MPLGSVAPLGLMSFVAWLPRARARGYFQRNTKPGVIIQESQFQIPTKHQNPGSELRNSAVQLQRESRYRGLELGAWDLFGIWGLGFGISAPAAPMVSTSHAGGRIALPETSVTACIV